MSPLSALGPETILEGVGWTILGVVPGGLVELLGSLSVEPVAVTALTVGVVGMSIRGVFDSILSEDDDADPGIDEGGGDDGLMPEEGGDDLDDLGGGFGGGDDEFGDFEDDEFGDMDGGADTDELEHRLDELETEVGSLSSTVNTVRNENEQISETVDDVEENVRKLLDIYEMVTRGVNPFADDIDAGGLGGPGEESFGLFDDDGDDGGEENLDEDIANADAEGFFDEDLVEDGDDLEADTDVGDVLGGDDDASEEAFEEDFDDEFGDADDDFEMDDGGFDDDFEEAAEAEADSDDGEGGKSFAELKDEYESGDADWAEDEAAAFDEAAEADEVDDEDDVDTLDEGEAEDLFEEESMGEPTDEPDDGLADDDLFDTVIEDEETGEDESEPDTTVAVEDDEPESTEAAVKSEPETADTTDEPEPTEGEVESEPETVDTTEEPEATEPEPTAAESVDGTADTRGETTNATDDGADDDGKPYLTDLPDGFVADLIIVEWLEFLVEDAGVRATAEAIDYYERIDWIDEAVADQLQAYLKGFEESGETASLTIDHHTRSLRYVSELDGGGAESVALAQLPGGGSNGLQR